MTYAPTTVLALSAPGLPKRKRRLGELMLCLALVAGNFASAQNFVKNPDFEEPLSSNNWSVVYVYGGPSDFVAHDRATIAHKDKVPGTWDGDPNYLDVYGGEFQPYHDGLMHAYFKQTVSGLQPLTSYIVSCWMVHFSDVSSNKVLVYLEALGGAAGNVSRTSPYVDKWCNENPSDPSQWQRYSVTNTASTSGQIEVRLHFDKNKYTSFRWEYIRAYYDHVSVMPLVQPALPFKILSMTLLNQTSATFKWESVMNNSYRVEASPNLSNWSMVRDDLLATGTNSTLTTNLTIPSAPLKFFRIYSKNYQP